MVGKKVSKLYQNYLLQLAIKIEKTGSVLHVPHSEANLIACAIIHLCRDFNREKISSVIFLRKLIFILLK